MQRSFPDSFGRKHSIGGNCFSVIAFSFRFRFNRFRRRRVGMRTDISLYYPYDTQRIRGRKIASDDRCTNGVCLHRLFDDAPVVRFDCRLYHHTFIARVFIDIADCLVCYARNAHP